MSWIQRLERRLEPYAVTNIALLIVVGQVFLLFTSMLDLIDLRFCVLHPASVLAGEWWRIFSFIFIPPSPGMFGYLFTAFALYLFYLYGTALEHYWGALRFNLFLLIGWILTVSLAFFSPHSIATNLFIAGSVFLAFAWLNPNFELLLFFVLPVKIKWLALFAWFSYAYSFATGGLSTKLSVIAAVGNFLLFFARDLWLTVRHSGRRIQRANTHRTEAAADAAPRHVCAVCKRTDLSHPTLDFRYAADDRCYCTDHLPGRRPPSTTDAPAS